MRCRLPILLDDEKGKREYSSNCLNSKTKKPLKFVKHGVECKIKQTGCEEGTVPFQIGICEFGIFTGLNVKQDTSEIEASALENTMKDTKTENKEKSVQMRGSKRRKKGKAEVRRSLNWRCITPQEKERIENSDLYLQTQYWTTKNRAYNKMLNFRYSDKVRENIMAYGYPDTRDLMGFESQKLVGLSTVVAETVKMLGITVTVVCDPPENADDITSVESACETDECGKKAVAQCIEETNGWCDSTLDFFFF